MSSPSRLLLAGIISLCWSALAQAEEPPPSASEQWESFSAEWSEAGWQPKGYIRRDDDQGWQARMRALSRFVQSGDSALPLLLETLKTGDAPQRILAAQTLGYMGSKTPVEPIVAALQSEADPAVRLYLVDALGMLGQGNAVAWEEFLKNESNGDIKRHATWVKERAGEPIAARAVNTLKQWKLERMNSAVLDQPAPDFTLQSLHGDTVRLSDFRGKKAVVLVFIYGDT